jgi:FtsH-binding integral membrane protein
LLQTDFVSKLHSINQDDFFVGLSSGENANNNNESKGLLLFLFSIFSIVLLVIYLFTYFSRIYVIITFFSSSFTFPFMSLFTASQECIMTKPIEQCTIVSTGITIVYIITIFP